MGAFVIWPVNLIAKVLLAEATVDFGRLEKYMDHLWGGGRQIDCSQEE